MANVLIIDDNDTLREGLAAVVRRMGHKVCACQSGAEALAAFARSPADFVITDLKMSGMDGLEVLRRIRELDPDCPTLLVTAYGTVEAAVEAMKLGAMDFLTKPFPPEVVRLKVERALELRAARRLNERLQLENERLRTEDEVRYRELVGSTEVMSKLYDAIGRVPPWQFWNVRDTRTLYDLAGINVKDYAVPPPHIALNDAIGQTRAANAALRVVAGNRGLAL